MPNTSDEEILEELRQIKKLLEPKPPAPPPPPPKNILMEFKNFLKTYKVMGLAVAFIMALYLGALVQALVQAFFIPLIGLLLPSLGDLANPAAQPVFMGQAFAVGVFLNALITFIIVAFVIFLLVKLTRRFGIE
nr:MscL family protein [Candidatus Sigynarchaeum springense]